MSIKLVPVNIFPPMCIGSAEPGGILNRCVNKRKGGVSFRLKSTETEGLGEPEERRHRHGEVQHGRDRGVNYVLGAAGVLCPFRDSEIVAAAFRGRDDGAFGTAPLGAKESGGFERRIPQWVWEAEKAVDELRDGSGAPSEGPWAL